MKNVKMQMSSNELADLAELLVFCLYNPRINLRTKWFSVTNAIVTFKDGRIHHLDLARVTTYASFTLTSDLQQREFFEFICSGMLDN